METPGYPMRLVARRTGLTAHVIRAWEKRYSAVTPHRTDTNRRLYTEEDVRRLSLLRDATAAGHSIGQIAQLPLERLQELVSESTGDPEASEAAPAPPPGEFLQRSLEAVQNFDSETLESTLEKASVVLSQPVLIEEVISPMLAKVGELWNEGKLRAAHEHMASASVRTLLGNLKESHRPPERAPKVVVTTPAGQLHELGALIATVTAAATGWRALFLGPNLPAQEIAAAANENQARVVALSIVYPPDDPHLATELRQLRRFLASDISIIAGGRAAHCYASELKEIGARTVSETASLRRTLEEIRSPAGPDSASR